MRTLAAVLCALAFAAPALAEEPEAQPEYNAILLQGLNKVTGTTSKLEGPLGASMRFGTLEIIPRRCWKAPPEERPESAGLLEISELKSGEQPQQIFLGWMFASSPGLSGLENPVYDITVLDCLVKDDAEKSDSPEGKPAAKEEKKETKTPEKKAVKKKP